MSTSAVFFWFFFFSIFHRQRVPAETFCAIGRSSRPIGGRFSWNFPGTKKKTKRKNQRHNNSVGLRLSKKKTKKNTHTQTQSERLTNDVPTTTTTSTSTMMMLMPMMVAVLMMPMLMMPMLMMMSSRWMTATPSVVLFFFFFFIIWIFFYCYAPQYKGFCMVNDGRRGPCGKHLVCVRLLIDEDPVADRIFFLILFFLYNRIRLPFRFGSFFFSLFFFLILYPDLTPITSDRVETTKKNYSHSLKRKQKSDFTNKKTLPNP